MRPRRILPLLALLCCLGGLPVRAACDLQLIHPGHITVFAGEPYDVFGSGLIGIGVEFIVRGRTPGCPFAIGFSSKGDINGRREARSGGARLAYRLSPDRRGSVRLQDLPVARPDEILSGVLPSGGREVRDIYFIVLDQGQQVAPGGYLDRLRINLFEGERGALVETVISMLRFDVESVIEARFEIDGAALALGGYTHVLDLGVLKPGLKRAFGLDIRTNVPFTVQIASQERGVLRHANGDPAAQVPYRLRVDGRSVELRSPLRLSGRADGWRRRGRRFPMAIEIGALDHALAGSYKDTLTVTVSAR